MSNEVYIKYLVEFYNDQVNGVIDNQSKPLSPGEIVGEEVSPYLLDLIEVISKMRKGG